MIRKAIIPVAGMGTRFLPATKAQPKEMLTVVDKPVIQYIVEEAVTAGIEEIIFVTAIGKRAIEDHFDRNFELEYRLAQAEKMKELEAVERIGKLAKFAFVRQAKPLGDGHALLSAAPFVGEGEAVAVLFGDDIIAGAGAGIAEVIQTFEETGAPVIGAEEVPWEAVSRYGILDVEEGQKGLKVKRFVEKPKREEAPSNLGVIGRYVITPEIFAALRAAKPGKDGEIRLADAFIAYGEGGGEMMAKRLSGRRFDCGNKLQFLFAQIELGLLHPDVGEELRAYLNQYRG